MQLIMKLFAREMAAFALQMPRRPCCWPPESLHTRWVPSRVVPPTRDAQACHILVDTHVQQPMMQLIKERFGLCHEIDCYCIVNASSDMLLAAQKLAQPLGWAALPGRPPDAAACHNGPHRCPTAHNAALHKVFSMAMHIPVQAAQAAA